MARTGAGFRVAASGLMWRVGSRLQSSLWLWPGLGIGVACVAGTLFGSFGVILSAEAFTGLCIAAGILSVSGDRWLTFGRAAALTASLAAIALTVFLHKSAEASPDAANRPADWHSQMVSQSMLSGADLRGADLDGANLDGLQLSHDNLDGARADGASFRGTQLAYASLRGASLRNACLAGANLTGADLAGADFTGADVAGVQVSPQATKTALAWPAVQAAVQNACQSTQAHG